MWTLGIETSDRVGAIALVRDSECVEERQLEKSGRRHAQTLVSEVDSMLRHHQLSPSDCDLVGVSIGPGSFTGLRVGVVFAKTLAYATGCQAVAVNSLHGLVQSAPREIERIWGIVDAQRSELFVRHFQRGGDFMESDSEVEIHDAMTWCQSRLPDEVITGTAIEKYQQELTQCQILDADLRCPRAESVARLAEREFHAGNVDDFWTLEPQYFRKSAAEEKWDANNSQPKL